MENKILRKREELGIEEIKKGVITKVLEKLNGRECFFIGDLHLDHKNIISYCKRPFNSVVEMNNTIVKNWNKTIRKKDIVYFLGDMAYGKGSRNTDYWLNKLKGEIVFIKGNHDKSKKMKFYNKLILNYKGNKFLLVHAPEDVPKDWKGWVIHGHHHNHKIEYPLVNRKKKTINVSVELLNYKPILFKDLLKKIK